MLTAVKIKPDVYWVGALDWNARSFHGYATEDGITYNAYLILDEKVTLIDTVKATFADELISRISALIDPAKIDVLIANHVEMDHSGSTPLIHKLAPQCSIYCSSPQGVKNMTAHYGDLGYHGVHTGDTLCIGKRTLSFIQTPMVHWPDNMVTFDVEDGILFSNDAFGQHYASSTRFDDDSDYDEVMKQARKYYANIVQPYRMQAVAATKAVCDLGDKVEMIAPAHGVVWRTHVKDVLDAYKDDYTSGKLVNKALVIYDSMWGSTDKIAHAICDGFLAEGTEVHLMDLKVSHPSDVMTEFLDAKYVAVGSPTLNSQMMPNVSGFLTYMKGLSPKQNNVNRIGIAFGSYGWAPVGPKNIHAELTSVGFKMPLPPLARNWLPDQAYFDDVRKQIRGLVRAQ